MPTLAIIGAGSNLGTAVARRFAREGFSIALLSRSQERLDALAQDLGGDVEAFRRLDAAYRSLL